MFDFMKQSNVETIHVNDMDGLLGKVNLIDIREPYEYQGGTLETAKNIPMGTLLNNPGGYMKKEEKYYILCQSGGRSSSAVNVLAKLGFNVVNVAGGYGSYVGTRRSY